MENLSIFHIKILQTLAERYGMSFSIEELTSLLSPIFNTLTTLTSNMSSGTENQARVLEALIFLNEQGYVFLNLDTDKSLITIKGLVILNDKVLCN
ncbi:hypothetical protein [Flavobacterium sp. KBS0721]|uniref:hypothetical protein n=1 Tax=Flavobacterium sp. KBS0721 TaxID=1179672 RepID=UPI00098F2BC2|nr:hypothetical protein [Flavobacterium sp. KBS0721]QDW22414.1 hypothetical protein B0M43_0020565 [Flavobacterium sp. KBS0721]